MNTFKLTVQDKNLEVSDTLNDWHIFFARAP